MIINVENNPFIKFVVGSGVVGSGVVGYRVVGGVTHSVLVNTLALSAKC